MAGGLITLAALLLGGVDTGWTFYEPYSTFYATGYVILAVFGIFVPASRRSSPVSTSSSPCTSCARRE